MKIIALIDRYKMWILIITVGCIIALIVGVIILYNFRNNNQVGNEPPVNNTERTSQNYKIIPMQKTNPGVTTSDVIAQLGQPRSVEDTSLGKQYNYKSASSLRDNQIIINGDTVIYEKIVTANPTEQYPSLSELVSNLGTPEREFTGSEMFGKFLKTYIYASQGFAVRGNEFKDEVMEIQVFVPTTVDGYIEKWGSDLKDYSNHTDHIY